MIFDVQAIEEIIGYSFQDKMLLRKCFTHASYAHEHKVESNEKLEFFGDAIIEFVVTEYLCTTQAGDEGVLTEKRKQIVSNDALLKIIKKLKLCDFLLQGIGQVKTKNYEAKKYASIFETLVAGIYIDGGLNQAKAFIKRTILANFEKQNVKKIKNSSSYKKEIQEYVQRTKIGSISYTTLSQLGPAHLPEFKVGLVLNGCVFAEGKGASKKKAEESAAKKALAKLIKQEGN